jgi:hypothetical protein
MKLATWIEEFPWSKAVVAAGIVAFFGILIYAGAVVLLLIVNTGMRPPASDHLLVLDMKDVFQDSLNAALWAMGIGGAAVVGKRAATKADVVTAQAQASAATTIAAAVIETPRQVRVTDYPLAPSPGPLVSIAEALKEPVKTKTPTGDVVYVHPASTGGGGDESDA